MYTENNEKHKIIELYKTIILNKINQNNSYEITNYINTLKLNENDYTLIKNLIEKELKTNKYTICATELENIIKIISNKIELNKIELLSEDEDPSFYIFTNTNKTYLINYDYIEARWYISLINIQNLTLEKEIYNSSYTNFIKFLENTLL